jgi:hypothetical protein
MTNFQESLLFLIDYFERTQDSSRQVFILSDNPSPGLINIPSFNEGNENLYIIDQFNGRQPWLINLDSVSHIKRGLTYDRGFIPTIILDSNILERLYKYINNINDYRRNPKLDREKIDNPQHKCTEKLLKFITLKNHDSNPCFYYVETLTKTKNIELTHDFFKKSANTIFNIHYMDDAAFLAENIITPDWQRVEEQKIRFRTNSDLLSDISKLWNKNMIESIKDEFLEMCRDYVSYAYATFLKIVLIHQTIKGKHKLLEKMDRLYDFLEQDIKVVLKREIVLGMYYFRNKLFKFLPKQLNKNFTDVQKELLKTAWDFFLLRFPEILLHNGCLSYICTAEKAIYKFSKLFTIETIDCPLPNVFMPAMLSLNWEEIERDLGTQNADTLERQLQIRQEARQSSLKNNKIEPISTEDLKQLISDLESQVSPLCMPN